MVALTVHEGAEFPPTCCRCGVSTVQTVTVRANSGGALIRWWPAFAAGVVLACVASGILVAVFGDDGTGAPLFLFLAYFVGIAGFAVAAPFFAKRSAQFSVRMPICRRCRREGLVTPAHVDFASYTMEFVVHREFREAYRVWQAESAPARDEPTRD